VQRVFLVTGRCCDRGFLAAEHPDLVVARVEDAASAAVLEPFPTYDGVPVAAVAVGHPSAVGTFSSVARALPGASPPLFILRI